MDATRSRPAIVVADDDLLFSSRISAALESLGYRPIVVRSPDAFRRELLLAPVGGIVNLAMRRFDAAAAIRDAKGDAGTRRVPLLGFCGHRDAGRQAAAREAGCDMVVTNGTISVALERLLHSLLTHDRHES